MPPKTAVKPYITSKSRLLGDKKAPVSASARLSQQLDKELASKAYKKVMAGEVPSASERAALKRFERDQEEQRRWQYYEAIPQKHWRQMSGRQSKVLQEQAERYGLPFGGRIINLPQLVRSLHNFLSANARRLVPEGDELLESGPLSPALERYREERAKMARLDRLAREGKLLPRDEVRDGLLQVAMLIRQAGETLGRQFGPEARQIVEEGLDGCQREIDRMFGEEESSLASGPPPDEGLA